MEIGSSARPKPRQLATRLALVALTVWLAGAGPIIANEEDGEADTGDARVSEDIPADRKAVTIRTIGTIAVFAFAPGTAATLLVEELLDENNQPFYKVLVKFLGPGKLSADFTEQFQGPVTVETTAKVSGTAEGTSIRVEVTDDGQVIFQVIEGQMTVHAGRRERLLAAGMQTLVLPGRAALPPSPISRYEPTVLLHSPEELEVRDPPLLDLIDPRIDPPKGDF